MSHEDEQIHIRSPVAARISVALAQGTYTQIDYPGAVWTACLGINNAGDIVGYYSDASNFSHGFLLSGGVYTTIDYPDFVDTELLGINDVGQIVGYAFGFAPTIGFLYDVQTQTFTEVAYPNAMQTFAIAINNAGRIAGYYTESDGDYQAGFELTGSSYQTISPPQGFLSSLVGITELGEVLGTAEAPSQRSYFTFTSYHRIYQIPLPYGLVASGINSAGKIIVGTNVFQGKLAAFLYQNGHSLQELQFPGSTATFAGGVNNTSEVAGYFDYVGGDYHGFLWTPPADAGKK